MNQTNASESVINEQTSPKKVTWISPDFVILDNSIIKGVGDAGPDFNAQLTS